MIVVLRLQDFERFSTTVKCEHGSSYAFALKVGKIKAWLPVYDTLAEARQVYPDGPFVQVHLDDVTKSFEVLTLGPPEQDPDHSGPDDDALMDESAQALAEELGWASLDDADAESTG